jgi:hypothetical protein
MGLLRDEPLALPITEITGWVVSENVGFMALCLSNLLINL